MDGPDEFRVKLNAAIYGIETRIALGLPIFDRWAIERAISSEVKPLWPNGVIPKPSQGGAT